MIFFLLISHTTTSQVKVLERSLKYFSLGDIDILQNPLDIPIIENPNEFTLDAAYSLKLNENFSLAVSGRFLLSDVKLQTVDLRPKLQVRLQ